MFRTSALFVTLAATSISHGQAQETTLAPDVRGKIGAIVHSVLSSTGVPSASLAIVKDGKIVFQQAYGESRLDPPRNAEPQMRYAIGSISKQFTAAAVMLLVEEGKLRLDDPVSKFFPSLTSASAVTIRMLLSHTSGYSDYWPQDYVMPETLQPTTPQRIIDQWAKRPLDFEPGTKWQYSNTNYVIVGQIVEKISGKPLVELLGERVFRPLAMDSVFDVDRDRLPQVDATGYYRHAFGPLRVAPKEGPGWLSAAGELAMDAEDLARWDISLINRSLLKPASYDEMVRAVHTKDGKETHYGLGLGVNSRNGHLYLEHDGEVSGFVANNTVIADVKGAVVVLTNEDAVNAAGTISREIEPLLIGRSPEEERALTIFVGLQNGHLDRAKLTSNCNAYFSEEAIDDYSSSLKPLGEPLSFRQEFSGQRGGMTGRSFQIHFVDRDLNISTYETPDGKLEQYLVSPRVR
jgi:D-alanyl-D-alanine carboxypeptidase